jgi:hypothetical protein
MATEQISISKPAPYLEAAGQTYLDLLTQKTGQAPTAAELQGMSPQVAKQNVLTQAAQQQAATQAGLGALTFDPTTGAVTGAGQGTGIAGYQPYLQQAQQYSGPQAYQQFMSPYQQDVINTTLTEYDRQRQIAQQGIASQAIQAGAFGGGREGVQQAEFGAQSLQNRAALQAQLLQQGYQSAQQAAGTAFSQQQALAQMQPILNAQTTQQLGSAGTSNLAYQQAVLDAQRKMVNNGDWRVRLSLAQGANYLYNASSPGILAPLAKTGGVIFPYTPKIETVYKADYDSYALTHSNYKGYFYKSSYNDAVGLTGTFTAQDTTEANYLLAVIHFFRSVTKMFYGQDAQRGAPPPLVYLTGLGQYQFSAHPCVVTSFTYSLPNDVDYIRAGSININGTDLTTRRVRQDLPTDPISGVVKRLENLFSSQGINKGAITTPPAPPTLGKNNPTYVPTKMEISLSLLPMQTRAQVSQVFSLKSFANGDLIKGGFW